jgi:acetyl esterase/lipase
MNPVAIPRLTRRSGLAGALLALLSGCSASRALDALVPSDSYRGLTGIAYGRDPRHKLDTYLPLTTSDATPLVVFFYGGSWTRGERADYRFVGEALASNGIAVVVPDYRLSPEVRWQDILADCAAATRWAHEHAAELGADPRQLFVMGHSAGAYNAAMLALDGRWLAAQGLQPGLLAGWIGIAGPYDFLPISDEETRVAFDWPRTPVQSQPIFHASPTAPRTLLLAAGNDTVVNPQRSTVGLARKLEAAGVPVRWRLFEQLNHVTALAAMARPLKRLAPVQDEVFGFITQGANGRA